MRGPLDIDALTERALALAGLMLLAAAALAGRMALQHMQQAHAICGSDGVEHCAWCLAAVASALSGLAALGAAAAPRLRAAQAR